MKIVSEGPDPLVVAIENAQRAVDSFGQYLDAAQALEDYINTLKSQQNEDDPCTGLTGEALYKCLLEQYGIEISEYHQPSEEREYQQIVETIQIVGEQLLALIIECGYEDSIAEQTPEAAFFAVYVEGRGVLTPGGDMPIQIRFSSCPPEGCPQNARYAKMDTIGLTGYGSDKSLLEIYEENLDLLPPTDFSWLITHELGHAFHNYLGDCREGDCEAISFEHQIGENTFVIEMQPPSGMPSAVWEYLRTTGGYYTEENDFGDRWGFTFFPNDPVFGAFVTPLTSLNSNPARYYVDAENPTQLKPEIAGNCEVHTNEQNVPFVYINRNGDCVSYNDAKYFIAAGTYIAGPYNGLKST